MVQRVLLTFVLSAWGWGAEFSDKLPIEIKQFSGSFDCFTSRDKMAINAYALALRYRMEHMEDKEALKKSSQDNWRLYSTLHDLEDRCRLDDLGEVIEGILAPTPALKKRLKRLRWAESAIRPPDGWAESSERMRRYDKKLLDSIVAHPPRWSWEPRNPHLHDYNLSVLKTLPPESLPKKLLKRIDRLPISDPRARNALLRYHLVNEAMIRGFDRPRRRLTLAQQRAWLSKCLDRFSPSIRGVHTGNFIRSLSASLVMNAHYYPLRTEFLPKEIEAYCEHNVSEVKVKSFVVPADSPVKTPAGPSEPTFEQTRKLLASFKKSGVDTRKFERYFQLTRAMLTQGNGQDLVRGLELIRLQRCLSRADANRSRVFFKTYRGEIKRQNLKEEFSDRVLRPQMWWLMTIAMKVRQEGDLPELKHFFDCNATTVKIAGTSSGKGGDVPKRARKNYNAILSQRDEILKYYAGTFVGTPTPGLDNAKAIGSGIVPPRWLEENGTRIKAIAGSRVEIRGMPEGGIKLTWRGIPKGRACERLTTLNTGDAVFFDHKTYTGLDYLLIDGQKVKTGRYFNRNRALRLCNARDTHTVSYVREKTVLERRYSAAPVESTCDRYRKRATIDTLSYSPNRFARSGDGRIFAVSGNKSYWYDATIPTRAGRLPRVADNAYRALALDHKGKMLTAYNGDGFAVYSLSDGKISKRIGRKDPKNALYRLALIRFSPDGAWLAGVDAEKKKSVSVIDLEKDKKLLSIVPKCFAGEKNSRYYGPRITALAFSDDGKKLYIGTNRKKVEIWRLERGLTGLGAWKATRIKTFEMPYGSKVGGLLPDPGKSDRLYVATENNRLYEIDTRSGKTLKTYLADGFLGNNQVQISDDGRYLLVGSDRGIYLWKRGETMQWEMFKGDGIKGGLFFPGSNDVIIVGKTIERWSQGKQSQNE
jgi:DNA-binding beta-propeller fold protein YncE